MKIHKVIFAAIICSCVQTADTSHDEEFIDPTDMEHYDQPTKSLKFTLKERESYKIFKALLQRLLENAEKSGLEDEENHYHAEVILTRQARAEISNFLKDKPCDPEVIEKHLDTFLINFKKHNEDEWKLKFEEFFQMEITKVEKLRILEDMFREHFKRILENTLKTGQRADLEGKVNDVEMEINKFLSDEDWDQEKLEIILENVTFKKEEGISFLMYFWSLVLIFVTSYAVKWIKRFYLREPAQIVEENREEEDDGYHEDPICAPIPETRENIVIQDIRSANQYEPSAERDRMDDPTSQSFKKSHTLTQDEKEDRRHEQDGVFTEQARPANNLLQNRECADVSNAEEPRTENDTSEPARCEMRSEPGALQDDYVELKEVKKEVKQSTPSPNVVESKDDNSVEANETFSHDVLHSDERQEDAAVLQDDTTESDRGDIESGPGSLRDEDLYSDMFLLNLSQIDNQKRHEHDSLSEEQPRCHVTPNVVDMKDENSANEVFSQSLSNEREQVEAEPDVKESTDSTDCIQELLSCDREEASGEKVIVGTATDTYDLKDISINEDEDSDFIVINESVPESLTFVQDEEHEESAESV